MMRLVLGIDVGTFETKGVLMDPDGRVVAAATAAHELSVPAPGRAEHDADAVWWGGLLAVVRELLAQPGVDPAAIEAVCCSGIGPCVLPVARGRALSPAILYGVDTRASVQIERLESALGRDAIRERSGNGLSSQSAGPKIAWLRDELPEIHAAAELFVTSQTYLVGRLTDEWVIDHGTASYFHPLYEIRAADWDLAGCEGFVRREQLPRLGWPTDVAGTVTAGAAAETGLRAGTPVLVGTADASAEAVSAGVLREGQTMLMYGSSHYLIHVASRPEPVDGLYLAPYVLPGRFAVAAGTSTSGTLTRWLWRLVDPEGPHPAYGDLIREAEASPPGARGLLALPYFSGERTPAHDPLLTGGLLGLTLEHTRGDVYRALLEGVAFGIGNVVDAFRDAGLGISELLAAGGGTRNPVWAGAISDVTGLRQRIRLGGGASLGDAMLAGLACGFLDDPDDMERWTQDGAVVEPDPDRARRYAGLRPLWTRFDETTRGISHDLRAATAAGARS